MLSYNHGRDSCHEAGEGSWKYYFSIAACQEQHQDFILWNDADMEERVLESDQYQFTNPFASDVISEHDPVSQFMESVPKSGSLTARDPPEMYLPGLVIHIVPQPRRFNMSPSKSQRVHEKTHCHKAYVANRESFKDIIVSPSMFLDHLPWRYPNTVTFKLSSSLSSYCRRSCFSCPCFGCVFSDVTMQWKSCCKLKVPRSEVHQFEVPRFFLINLLRLVYVPQDSHKAPFCRWSLFS